MIRLSIRTVVRNAAAVFSAAYGSVTRQAREVGCSRQTIYDHARRIEQQLQTTAPATPPVEVPVPTPTPLLDELTRRRFAVTAFALGVSTRQIEDLLRVLLGADGPDHSTIARWVADAAEDARLVLEPLDAACIPQVQTLALDEIFFGGDRPWSASSRRA
jgi:phosphoglycolate phosphatase-like HAD superfamily hydrolase